MKKYVFIVMSLVLVLISCQSDKETVEIKIENYTVDTLSFLANIVKIVDTTNACKLIPLAYPVRFYPMPIGYTFDLETFDRDRVLANKKVYRQVFDIWKDKSILVKNVYENDISYFDQMSAIRDSFGVPSFYSTTFWKTVNYDDIKQDEFVKAWLFQLDSAKKVYFVLFILVILFIIAVVSNSMVGIVLMSISIIFLWGGFFVLLIIGPRHETDKSSLNLSKLTDHVIEVIKSSP